MFMVKKLCKRTPEEKENRILEIMVYLIKNKK